MILQYLNYMKNIISLLFIFLCSCTQEIHIPDKIDKDSTISVLPIKKITYLNVFSQDTNRYRYLGCGFDCTISNFDGVVKYKSPIIDLNRFLKGEGYDLKTGTFNKFEPGNIEEGILHSGDYKRIYGSSFDEYVQNLVTDFKISDSIGTNKLFLFYKEFSEAFDDDSLFLNGSSFYKINKTIYTRRFTMSDIYPPKLKYFLTDQFKQDLYKLSGDEIIQKYGTHILTDILMGGTCSFIFNAKINSSIHEFKQQSLKFTHLVCYDTFEKVDTILFKGLKKVNICIRTIGGTVPVTQIEEKNDLKVIDNYSFHYMDWLNSVNIKNEQLVNIGNNTTQIYLISEFIDDIEKRKEIETAIIKYTNKTFQ